MTKSEIMDLLSKAAKENPQLEALVSITENIPEEILDSLREKIADEVKKDPKKDTWLK